ncbi:hypothetical protein [Paenibacillus sp. 453mf]|uniref:hypothetical protein n=1 Tax=Paenibacillus sp. 453mf TaxID=1761874 RepID=UPI0008DF5376|nr:hypothetical protein [Paenibacillus sp. 453mf]SFT00463.1 hypothetical protein SAMN04488601_1195 [Paenibacillus sp. 453mf]
MIRQVLEATWAFFSNLFSVLFGFIADLFGFLFQKLFDFLKLILRPFFIVVALILYFIYKIAELAITLIKVFLALGKLLIAFIKGIFVTLAGFTYTPTTPNQGSWTPIFKNVMQGLDSYQLNTVAFVLMFCIWFATGFAVIRILGSIRNGGD